MAAKEKCPDAFDVVVYFVLAASSVRRLGSLRGEPPSADKASTSGKRLGKLRTKLGQSLLLTNCFGKPNKAHHFSGDTVKNNCKDDKTCRHRDAHERARRDDALPREHEALLDRGVEAYALVLFRGEGAHGAEAVFGIRVERHCLALAAAFREGAREAGAAPVSTGQPSHIAVVQVRDPDSVRTRLRH